MTPHQSASSSCCYPRWGAAPEAATAATTVMADRYAHYMPPNDPPSRATAAGTPASCCYQRYRLGGRAAGTAGAETAARPGAVEGVSG